MGREVWDDRADLAGLIAEPLHFGGWPSWLVAQVEGLGFRVYIGFRV